MNKEIIKDKVFKIYSYLPWIQKTKAEYIKKQREAFKGEDENITIVCPTCIAGEIYSILGMQMKSPFINVSMDRREFITLCENLKLNMKTEPVFNLMGNYVEADINGNKIKFIHDNDVEKCKSAWYRRLDRMNWDRILLITDDRGLYEDDYARFDKLPYKKIMLTSKDIGYKWQVILDEYKGEKEVGKYNEKASNGLWKFTKSWDFVKDIKAVINE